MGTWVAMLEIETVKYRINWAKFKPGYSFFVPCVNPTNARGELQRFAKLHGLEFVTKLMVVDGVQGLRVWKM